MRFLNLLTLILLSTSRFLFADPKEQIESQKLYASDAQELVQFGYSISSSEKWTLIGCPYDNEGADRSGAAYLFDTETGEQLLKLKANELIPDSEFGKTVSTHGRYAVISASEDSSKAYRTGSVYVFDMKTGKQLYRLVSSDAAEGDIFGSSVAISDKYVVVGAQLNDDKGENSGSVYIFDLKSGKELASLTAEDGKAGGIFGVEVAISNNWIVVGAAADDEHGDHSGAVYVFDASTFQQKRKIVAEDGIADAWFGMNLTLSGEYAIIGANRDKINTNNGSAYIYNVATGKQIHKLLPKDKNRYFGSSVSAYKNKVLIGAPTHSEKNGAVYLFNIESGAMIKKYTASDTTKDNAFGYCLSLSHTRFIVGTYLSADKGKKSGAAYVYDVK